MAGILDYLNPFQAGGYDPNQQTNTTGTNLPNVFMTPDLYKAGLLSDQNVQNQLQQQATKTGGILSAVDFITRPRTMNAGGVLPYLGEAYKTGFGGAQNVYNQGLNQLLRTTAFGQKDSPFAKLDRSKYTTESVAKFEKTKNYSDLDPIQESAFKETPSWLGKAEFESFDRIGGARGLVEDTSKYINKFASGQIPVGVIESPYTATKAALGVNDEDVVAYKDFARFKKQLVNESLRLNKGVQTEGDAQRAAAEFESARSEADHIAAMTRLRQVNQRAIANELEKVRLGREGAGVSMKGMPEMPQYNAYQLPNSPKALEIANRFSWEALSDKDYPAIQIPSNEKIADEIVDRLPEGAYFVGPDGKTYQKPYR